MKFPARVLLIVLPATAIAVALISLAHWGIEDQATYNLQQRGAVLLVQSDASQFNTDQLTVAEIRLISTGAGRDGLPSLVNPPVVAAGDALPLNGDDRVVGVTVGDESRAYPVAILNWHECVNDTVGGVPIAVAYCPLCDSVSVFDRRPPGRDEPLTFGVAGLLLDSNLVLYDRTDDALWSQVKMEALSGPHAGTRLPHLEDWQMSTLATWQTDHPSSTVVSSALDSTYDFHEPRLAGYATTDELRFPVRTMDDRLPVKTRVIGIQLGKQAKAWPLAWIRQQPNGRVKTVWAGGTVELTALDDGGVDVVQVPQGAGVVHTYWFAWATLHPGTAVAE